MLNFQTGLLPKIKNVEFGAVQKCAHLVELEKCCRTHIFLRNVFSNLFDTAENEPAKNLQNVAKTDANFANFANLK